MNALRLIDLPPVWLLGFGALGYGLAKHAPLLRFDGPIPFGAGVALILGGLALALWAVLAFARARTTVMPRSQPSALVTEGPFRLSRNPIYLADALILIGWAACLGALSALLLAPAFIWIIERRFIADEEAGLRAAFPEAFARYADRVRRWI